MRTAIVIFGLALLAACDPGADVCDRWARATADCRSLSGVTEDVDALRDACEADRARVGERGCDAELVASLRCQTAGLEERPDCAAPACVEQSDVLMACLTD